MSCPTFRCSKIIILISSIILLFFGIAFLITIFVQSNTAIYKSSNIFSYMRLLFIYFGCGLGIPIILISIVGIILG